ncbi:hypothetical protein [Phormidesmis priestleyi]|uniref:hypothetical protein n=1 Tax=Phormidesmis priestleyi TaxID=268141 RepID=UPI000A78B7D2|nr:hypothetical protein [Phormidesmis priestleyi]
MYQFELAADSHEIDAYFERNDRDDIDQIAYPIVAIAPNQPVIGVVRIYEVEPGVWYGGRLGTHVDYRKG